MKIAKVKSFFAKDGALVRHKYNLCFENEDERLFFVNNVHRIGWSTTYNEHRRTFEPSIEKKDIICAEVQVMATSLPNVYSVVVLINPAYRVLYVGELQLVREIHPSLFAKRIKECVIRWLELHSAITIKA